MPTPFKRKPKSMIANPHVVESEQALIRAWMEMARDLDLTYAPSTEGLGPTLTGRIGELEVTLWALNLGETNDARWLVRAQGKRAGASWADLEVRNETALSRFAKRLGFDDIQLGDAAFDGAFHVSADNPSAAKAFLDAPTREAVAELGPTMRLEANGNTVHLEWEGDPTERSELQVARRILARIAELGGAQTR